ncbi:MAG: lysophospholipid acyltransferase family protein [Gemmataceae bacterium]
MKLRHPLLLRGVGFAVGWLVKAWVGTLRYRRVLLGPDADPTTPGQAGRFLYTFWHETLLLPAFRYSQTPTKVLISEHADGELIAQACRHLGLGVVRGSTTRGGVKAVREVLKLGGKKHLVVTPDGPRGPRRQFQQGAIFLAARTGLPIVPVGFAYHNCWRLRSWDRFALPCPFSPAVGVLGAPIRVPPDAGRHDIELWRQKGQAAMDEVTARAEEAARQERW